MSSRGRASSIRAVDGCSLSSLLLLPPRRCSITCYFSYSTIDISRGEPPKAIQILLCARRLVALWWITESVGQARHQPPHKTRHKDVSISKDGRRSVAVVLLPWLFEEQCPTMISSKRAVPKEDLHPSKVVSFVFVNGPPNPPRLPSMEHCAL